MTVYFYFLLMEFSLFDIVTKKNQQKILIIS